jgi:hypothetical protein
MLRFRSARSYNLLELQESCPPTAVAYDETKKVMLDLEHDVELSAGLLPAYGFLDVNKLKSKFGLNFSQKIVNNAIVKAAIEFADLRHIKYRQTYVSKGDLNGRITAEFDCVAPYVFILNNSSTPSRALKSLYFKTEDPLILDCAIAVQIIYYKAILDLVGDQQFDQLFAANFLLEARLAFPCPLSELLQINKAQELTPIGNPENFLQQRIPGERLYFKNIVSYLPKHPNGEASGFNLVYLGRRAADGQHIFAGLFDPDGGVQTYDYIMYRFASAFNKEPHQVPKLTQSRASFG